MRRYTYLILLVFVASCANLGKSSLTSLFSSKEEKEAVQSEQQNINYTLYEVLSTDTIASISRKYKVSASEIIALNKIPKPYYLEPGVLIKIPRKDEDLPFDTDSKSNDNVKKATVNIVPVTPPKTQVQSNQPSEGSDNQVTNQEDHSISQKNEGLSKEAHAASQQISEPHQEPAKISATNQQDAASDNKKVDID